MASTNGKTAAARGMAITNSKDSIGAIGRAAHLDPESTKLIKAAAAQINVTEELIDLYGSKGFGKDKDRASLARTVRALEQMAVASFTVGKRSIEQSLNAGTIIRLSKDTIGHGNFEFWLSRAGYQKDAAQRLMAASLAVEKFPHLMHIAGVIGLTELAKLGRKSVLDKLTPELVDDLVEYVQTGESKDAVGNVRDRVDSLLGKEDKASEPEVLPFNLIEPTTARDFAEALTREFNRANSELSAHEDVTAIHKLASYRTWLKNIQASPESAFQKAVGGLLASCFMLDMSYKDQPEGSVTEVDDEEGLEENEDLFPQEPNDLIDVT